MVSVDESEKWEVRDRTAPPVDDAEVLWESDECRIVTHEYYGVLVYGNVRAGLWRGDVVTIPAGVRRQR